MIRRLEVPWPVGRGGTEAPAFRVLAVSDEIDPALEFAEVRRSLGRIDLVVGCGDLDPGYLAMLGDAFMAPLLFVHGNHDRGIGWSEHRHVLPDALVDGKPVRVGAIRLAGFNWPGAREGRADRDDLGAWMQVLRLAVRLIGRGGEPLLLISHVPPAGTGDVPVDRYHRGFRAYDWLARRLNPPLWLHGHSPLAACLSPFDRLGATRVVNVTGATLVELQPVAT
ncbi:MAG: hypothetical protein H0T04_04240 [Chloroflexi bacterium]|nr:hypothetical protein [Chloroflexota bacterium]MDQ3407791.1 hypothetical protein [Chloroflexota bacterium]